MDTFLFTLFSLFSTTYTLRIMAKTKWGSCVSWKLSCSHYFHCFLPQIHKDYAKHKVGVTVSHGHFLVPTIFIVFYHRYIRIMPSTKWGSCVSWKLSCSHCFHCFLPHIHKDYGKHKVGQLCLMDTFLFPLFSLFSTTDT